MQKLNKTFRPKTIEKFKLVYKDYELTHKKEISCKKFKMCRKTFNALCEELNFNSNLRKKCKDYGVFNKIDSHDKAYCLGFIAADGCVSYGKINIPLFSVKIKSTDIDVLYFLRDTIKSTHKINIAHYKGGEIEGRKINRSECATFYIRNTQLCEDLVNLGIVPNKTFNMSLPPIEDKFFNSWLLGYLDGDGFITKRSNRNNIQLGYCCADTLFLNQLKNKINDLYKIEGIVYTAKNRSIDYLVFNHTKTLKLCEIIYKDSLFYLERKYIKFAPFKSDLKCEVL